MCDTDEGTEKRRKKKKCGNDSRLHAMLLVVRPCVTRESCSNAPPKCRSIMHSGIRLFAKCLRYISFRKTA